MSTTDAMTPLAEFLERLFETGEARLAAQPERDESADVQRVLRAAFEEYRLEIAGPPIVFEPNAAIAAAVFTALACWFAVSTDEPPDEVAKVLKTLHEPKSAGAHLSMDLTLRFSASVYRRAHARNENDVLTVRLSEILCQCPLTGSLTDIAAPPTGDLTFDGHSGLQLLYAERLAGCVRENWIPADGSTREHIDLVFERLGVKRNDRAGD